MTLYIDPFWGGFFLGIVVGIAAIVILAIVFGKSSKNKE